MKKSNSVSYRRKPRTYVCTCEGYTHACSPHRARQSSLAAFFFYRETKLDEVSHVHRHLLDLSGVELLDITEVPHVALQGKSKKNRKEGRRGGTRGEGAGYVEMTLTKTSLKRPRTTAVPGTEKSLLEGKFSRHRQHNNMHE